jgi:hypothetical protein
MALAAALRRGSSSHQVHVRLEDNQMLTLFSSEKFEDAQLFHAAIVHAVNLAREQQSKQ